MPLYGQSEGANTLYIARCVISGDHDAAIEAFEPIDVDDQRRLPHGESIVVGVGEPWRDVFLWNDAAYVGTPAELWAELTPQHPDVEARAPLSLLDLAINARRDEVSTLAPAAFAFVEERYGEPRARSWRRQFVRQQAEVAFRRALSGQPFEDALFRAISVRETGWGVLTFNVPDALVAAASSEVVVKSMARVAELATFLGATLVPPLGDASASPPSAQPIPAVPAAAGSLPTDRGDDAPVLIIAEGKRASEVVRHLRSERDRFEHPAGVGWEIVTDLELLIAVPDRSRAKSVVAVILSEDEKAPIGPSADIRKLLDRQAAAGALVLLAPALPPRRPSALFDRSGAQEIRMAHAILDTAIARSPFWWGNPKRSFERRISDVVQLAVDVAQSPVVRRELLERRPDEPTPILSVGLLSPSADPDALLDRPGNLRLGSEASWVAGDPKRSDPAVLFSVRINPDEVGAMRYETQVIVEGRRRENRFPEFASRVIAPVLARRHRRPFGPERRLEQLPALPSEIEEALQTPRQAAAFAVEEGPGESLRLALTAETPSLDAVERANQLGWKIVRYTDTATLRRLADGTEPPATFPDEIEMGPIHSSGINRHLATRGVDQRDVIRVTYDLLSEWLDGVPPAERAVARRNARPLRSATHPPGERESDHLLLRDYVLGTDPAARQLSSLISEHQPKSLDFRAKKRASDLLRCWTQPSSGFQRHAIVDGAVPVIVFELRHEEIPLQDLFVVDGDFAVPALFRSRVFAVWARATLPTASSWMARFSVANTFGGFPIGDKFRIVGQEGSLAALVADGAPSAMQELVEEVTQHIERAQASQPPANWKEAHRPGDDLPAMRRLNELVLNAYGLPGDASDIQILRRLLEMNAAL